MNNHIKLFLSSLLLLFPIISCQSPETTSRPKPGSVKINTSNRVDLSKNLAYFKALKPLPNERWASARKPDINFYPPLAGIAKFGGDVTIALEIESSGHVIKSEFISGPVPLAAYMESIGKQIQFYPEAKDQPGPWSFIIVGRFDPAGYIGFAPIGTAIELKPVKLSNSIRVVN